MKLIAVALDVSKLTGWLNTSANCRVKVHAIRGASEVCGPGRGLEGGGAGACGAGAGAQAARTRRSRDWGQGTRDGHHINMPYMYVTLDVSKLTSWLKFFASCRVEKRECETRVRCAEAARRGSWGAGGSG